MVMFSPRREPEPDLRVQFAEYAEVMGYPLQKRIEDPPRPCVLCGGVNCTGDETHGEEHDPFTVQPPQWWLSAEEDDQRGSEPE